MRADEVLAEDANRAEFGGLSVRKGTIAAFLMNARVWSDPTTGDEARRQAEADIRDAAPALRAVGLFEVLAVKDAALAKLLAEA
ncbi:hypothetical protein RN629_11795 [Sphingomonadaceae bacterium jetA1]|jgi:hypothetical protein|uniref:hypothetical protein n=1 Tax=Facivitalis istanbulensis TaxID=3075838 RepID=UPI0034831518